MDAPRPPRHPALVLAAVALTAAAGPGALVAQTPPAPPAPAATPRSLAAPAVRVSEPQFPLATPGTERAPRQAGGWIVCTRDAQFEGSLGAVVALDLATGTEHELGPGFLPDVDVYPAEGGGARSAGSDSGGNAGAGAPVVRVAWMRLHDDGRLSIEQAVLHSEGWTRTELAADVGCAERLRVCGRYTVWTAADASGTLAVQLHDGRELTRPSSSGAHAFRPELARSAGGAFALVWDEYRGTSATALDYEVCGRFRAPGGEWTPTVELSAASGSLDFAPSVAPAADGGWWIAWETDRGTVLPRVFVAHRDAAGALALPRPYPPSDEPERRGLVDLVFGAPTMHPVVGVDGAGRLWLIVENKVMGRAPLAFDKRLFASVYGEAGWSEPVLLPGEIWGEKAADALAAGDALAVVYQSNRAASGSLDVARVELDGPAPPAAPALAPPPPPAPAVPVPPLRLPEERTLELDGASYRLLFADLHSHCGQSPDGVGERDHALFWARDMVRIDAWASTDHDETQREPMLDWEYELALRFVDHFDSPAFTTFMGFEWSNHVDTLDDEIIGHRATFSSRRCYRYVDPACDELPEYYAAMRAEDAIGVPHHLGKFGGTSFLAFDAQVQPVTEVSSAHGQFEDELVAKLAGGVRFGVTAAGDDHLAMPGGKGLAGIFCDTRLPSRRDAIKQALRERRCFGVVKHGLYADLRLDGRPMGAELRHAGDLLLAVRVSDLPVEGRGTGPAQPVLVNLSVNGDHGHPVWSRVVPPGGRLDDLAVLPGRAEDAFYMLRVTRGAQGTAPKDTILWSSPIWVDAEPADGYPRASIAAGAATVSSDTPVTLELSVSDPDGPTDLVSVSLHVSEDGSYTGTTPLPSLAGAASSGSLSLPLGTLAPGERTFIVEARDSQGHVAVASASLTITPRTP